MDFLPADYKVKKQKNFPASREEIKKITRKEKALIDANIEVSSDLNVGQCRPMSAFAQTVHQRCINGASTELLNNK